MGKNTKQNISSRVSGVPGNWRTFTGGSGSSETSLDYDGGAPKPSILSGAPTFEDIVVTRTYDKVADASWIRNLRSNLGRSRHTVTKFTTDVNYVAIGTPDTYPDCLLKGISEPEGDAASLDSAEVSLTFATTGPA